MRFYSTQLELQRFVDVIIQIHRLAWSASTHHFSTPIVQACSYSAMFNTNKTLEQKGKASMATSRIILFFNSEREKCSSEGNSLDTWTHRNIEKQEINVSCDPFKHVLFFRWKKRRCSWGSLRRVSSASISFTWKIWNRQSKVHQVLLPSHQPIRSPHHHLIWCCFRLEAEEAEEKSGRVSSEL